MKLLFAKSINNTPTSGIVDVLSNELLCLCDYERAQIIIAAFELVEAASDLVLVSVSTDTAGDDWNLKYKSWKDAIVKKGTETP